MTTYDANRRAIIKAALLSGEFGASIRRRMGCGYNILTKLRKELIAEDPGNREMIRGGGPVNRTSPGKVAEILTLARAGEFAMTISRTVAVSDNAVRDICLRNHVTLRKAKPGGPHRPKPVVVKRARVKAPPRVPTQAEKEWSARKRAARWGYSVPRWAE